MLDVSPRELEIGGEPGELILFRINASSDAVLEQFTITRVGNFPDTILLDTLINGKSFSLNWGVNTPQNVNQDIHLLFRIIDEDGSVSTEQRVIRPAFQNTLQEFTNNIMFSYANASFNAYDLNTVNVVTYDSLLFDSLPELKPDLREFNNNPLATPFDLSGLWYSPSGGKFVKTGSLNFSSANKADLVNYFNGNFIQTNFTDSLEAGDIYAFRSKPDSAGSFYCLIRIDQVNFNGSSPANYVFSVKK